MVPRKIGWNDIGESNIMGSKEGNKDNGDQREEVTFLQVGKLKIV